MPRGLRPIAALALVAVTAAMAAAEWPCFRGPDARGVAADDPRLPSRWTATKNVRWSATLEGRGWSSPIVSGDRVIVTSAIPPAPPEDAKKGLYFVGDRLYVVNDNEDDSFVAALDAPTGREIWRMARDEKSNWSTPFVWQNGVRTELVAPGTGKTRSYSLDGRLLWQLAGGSAITIATPYAAHGLLYVSSGFVLDRTRPIWAIRPGADGDLTLPDGADSSAAIAWCRRDAAPYNPTTLVYGDELYVLADRGLMACYDARTGEQHYRKERLPEGRAFTASPWAYNGLVFCANEYGETFVVRAGPKFELVHTNMLGEEDMVMASPAITGGRVFLRTDRRLYCLENAP